MAEGTRFAKIEAATMDLYRTQEMMDDRLSSMDSGLVSLEETLRSKEQMM